jgi:adenylate kinase family enzyme
MRWSTAGYPASRMLGAGLARCRPAMWVVPDGAPFSMPSYYAGEPVFDAAFREAFARGYALLERLAGRIASTAVEAEDGDVRGRGGRAVYLRPMRRRAGDVDPETRAPASIERANMKRVLVVGSSGSGKSTMARWLAARLGAPHVELDALQHGSNWVPRPTFEDDVDEATRAITWVVDGNYPTVRELLWSRADTVVWLDLPRWLIEWRVVLRSARRWAMRIELWNGNREPSPLRWLDPEHPVRWSWTKHREYRERYTQRFADPAWADLLRIRLRTPADVDAFQIAVTVP